MKVHLTRGKTLGDLGQKRQFPLFSQEKLWPPNTVQGKQPEKPRNVAMKAFRRGAVLGQGRSPQPALGACTQHTWECRGYPMCE